jgi:hypothetical protein
MPSLTIACAGEQVTLLTQRAIFWPRTATLLIADPHFGKDATFRAAGLGLPTGPLAADLARLDSALLETQAERLIILGDLSRAWLGQATGWPVISTQLLPCPNGAADRSSSPVFGLPPPRRSCRPLAALPAARPSIPSPVIASL